MNKKAMIFTRARDTVSSFVGLFVTAFGLIPLLHDANIIDFNIPFIGGISIEIFIWLVAFFGAYIVIDGFIEPPAHNLHWILIIAGLILFAVGLIPILSTFNVISFTIPFIGKNLLVYRVILTIEGIALFVGGLTEH